MSPPDIEPILARALELELDPAALDRELDEWAAAHLPEAGSNSERHAISSAARGGKAHYRTRLEKLRMRHARDAERERRRPEKNARQAAANERKHAPERELEQANEPEHAPEQANEPDATATAERAEWIVRGRQPLATHAAPIPTERGEHLAVWTIAGGTALSTGAAIAHPATATEPPALPEAAALAPARDRRPLGGAGELEAADRAPELEDSPERAALPSRVDRLGRPQRPRGWHATSCRCMSCPPRVLPGHLVRRVTSPNGTEETLLCECPDCSEARRGVPDGRAFAPIPNAWRSSAI